MNKAMIVAGVMSGTSADGINVALVSIGEARDSGSRVRVVHAASSRGQECPRHTIELLGHTEYSYPAKVRAAELALREANKNLAQTQHAKFIAMNARTAERDGIERELIARRATRVWSK